MNGQSGGVLGWEIPEDFGDGAFSAPAIPDAPAPQQALPPALPPAGSQPPWNVLPPSPPAGPSAVPFGTRPAGMPVMHHPAAPMMMGRPRGALGNPDLQNGGHMLGLSTVAVGLAAIVGANYGGVYGGLAGSLFGGAGINAWRAVTQLREGTPDGKHEALVSGTYALLAAAIGGYVAYKATTGAPFFGHPAKWNGGRSGEPANPNPTRCRFRPIT